MAQHMKTCLCTTLFCTQHWKQSLNSYCIDKSGKYNTSSPAAAPLPLIHEVLTSRAVSSLFWIFVVLSFAVVAIAKSLKIFCEDNQTVPICYVGKGKVSFPAEQTNDCLSRASSYIVFRVSMLKSCPATP
jgi:hypothetical protein